MSVALFAGLVSCGEPYHAPLSNAPTFPLEGKHLTAPCDSCHTESSPPYTPVAWDPNCVACHEVDRPSPDHFPNQGCANTPACHQAADDEFVGHHDFLPLEGVHDFDCTVCHGSDTPSNTDLKYPAGASAGGGASCAGCHDIALNNRPTNHFVEAADEMPGGALLGWDCNACHDLEARAGQPIEPGFAGAGFHKNAATGISIRYPHGTTTGLNTSPTPSSQWVTDCNECHANGLPPATVTCTVSCHQDIFTISPHTNFAPGVNDAGCTGTGCHVYADGRFAAGTVGFGG